MALLIDGMAWDDLGEDGRAAVLRLLRETIATDPHPLSPNVQVLRRALAKLDPNGVSARMRSSFVGKAAEPRRERTRRRPRAFAVLGSPVHAWKTISAVR